MPIDTNKIHKDFSNFSLVAIQAATDAVKNISFDLLAESQIRCPIHSGELRSSGHVKEQIDAASIVFNVVFAKDYALKVHEGDYNLGPRSVAAGPLVGRKFITRAWIDNDKKYRDFFVKSLNSSIHGSS